jgi:hypothetical protein
MRGLYAHASDRMRADLRTALQTRWEESLRARAAIHPHSSVPLLDKLMAPHRPSASTQTGYLAVPAAGRRSEEQRSREKMISQIPPRTAAGLAAQGTMKLTKEHLTWLNTRSDWVELRGFEPLTPSMRTRCATGLRYSPKTGSQRSKLWRCSARPRRPKTRNVGPALL